MNRRRVEMDVKEVWMREDGGRDGRGNCWEPEGEGGEEEGESRRRSVL